MMFPNHCHRVLIAADDCLLAALEHVRHNVSAVEMKKLDALYWHLSRGRWKLNNSGIKDLLSDISREVNVVHTQFCSACHWVLQNSIASCQNNLCKLYE